MSTEYRMDVSIDWGKHENTLVMSVLNEKFGISSWDNGDDYLDFSITIHGYQKIKLVHDELRDYFKAINLKFDDITISTIEYVDDYSATFTHSEFIESFD